MITTLLCMALGASGGWKDVDANGFSFEMPTTPKLETAPVTWPTTGKMTHTEWTSKLETGDKQIDTLGCYESTVPSPTMVRVLYDKLCKENVKGERRWDHIDPVTQAKECLLVTAGADGKRRTLIKVLQVGANVCALSSSAMIDQPSDEASATMRRFVDSLKLTGKQTVVSLTPWATMKGDGFVFEMPKGGDPKITEKSDPALGKHTSTIWVYQLPEEELKVTCLSGPAISSEKAMKALLAPCEQPRFKIVKTTLPTGATECAIWAQETVLMRVFPLKSQTCVVTASRKTGESSQDARRFVESFAKAK